MSISELKIDFKKFLTYNNIYKGDYYETRRNYEFPQYA